MTLFTLTVILFLIMDPVGNLLDYKRVMNAVPEERRNTVLLREMGIALAVAITFNFIGEFFFQVLDLSETAVRLASGAVMFLIAFQMLFPKHDAVKKATDEPYIFPLAIPMMSGPALLATIMLFAHMEPGVMRMNIAIVVAWLLSLLILFFARPIKRTLTVNGVTALERLMGMILLLLSVQRFMEGIKLFVSTT